MRGTSEVKLGWRRKKKRKTFLQEGGNFKGEKIRRKEKEEECG